MEEMKLKMRINPEKPRKLSSSSHISSDSMITTSMIPTWKLYENPFYIISQHQQDHHQHHHEKQKQIHHLHLPISARKIASSFWDLTFIKPLMESELETARAQILELKTELNKERKARKKTESMNKKLAREVSEERKGREALSKVCEELARETSSNKAEISRLKKEIEQERKMLRVAEVLREERVQMKLSEAKHLLEEKLTELEATKQLQIRNRNNDSSSSKASKMEENHETTDKSSSSISNSDDKPASASASASASSSAMGASRRASQEPENPHIKRGIKGFVEFPKVVKAIGSKSIKRSGTKLECQKAQIKMLLSHKNPLPSNTTTTPPLITS